MSSYLSASPLIVQRLKDKTNVQHNKIRAAKSDKWILENCLDDSVSVVFFDTQPVESKGGQIAGGRKQFSEQFWLILMSSRNVADCGNAARIDLGVIMDEVLAALQGCKLSAKHGELYRTRSPYRMIDDGSGFVHASFMFKTKVSTTGIGNE